MMHRIFCLTIMRCPGLILALLIAGCVTTGNYLEKGRQYMAAGEWDRSIQFFQEVLERSPDDLEAQMMLKSAKWQGSEAYMSAGEQLLARRAYDQAIESLQMGLAMNPLNRKAAALIERARDHKRSDFYLNQGITLLKTGQYQQSREAFQRALKLNPDNAEAAEHLSRFVRGEPAPKFPLKRRSDQPISLKFKNTPVINVFEILSSLSAINFIFDKDVRDSKVTLFMTDVSMDTFLEMLLGTAGLAGKVVDENTMIIYPNTPKKMKEYQDLQIRTFYLSYLSAKQAVGMLSKVLRSKYIIANEELNAIVIRAPEDVIDVATRMIEANDRAVAEVLLNVEILEASHTKEKQLGLELNPASVTIGIGEDSPEISNDTSFAERASIRALSNLTSREVILSVPTATLNFLKQDGDTRTLANPQIRVKSGNQSAIHIGERIPLRTNRRVDTTGVVTFDYQYYDIGVKLTAKPTINLHGEITLDMRLEVSALGPNIGTSDDPQYAILTRTSQSVLTVYNGEAVVIAGLISDEERKTFRKVPVLGEIPMLSRIFSNENSEDRRTDILMAITPVVIRDQDVPDMSVIRMWSGSEETISPEIPYQSKARERYRYRSKPVMPRVPEYDEALAEPLPPLQIR